MAKKLTDQQQVFLEVLFGAAKGDVVVAKKLAGYSETYPVSQIIKNLEDEIIDVTKKFLSRSGPKAAISLVDVLDNPTTLGIKEKLAAAKDILDRIGVSKTEKVEVGGSGGIFILPAKERKEDAEDS